MNNIDPKSKNAKERKAKLQKEIDKHKDQRDHEKEIYTQLREDEKTLIADQTEAGFSFREAQIAFSDIQNEFNTASPNAQQALNEQNAQDAASAAGATGGGAAGTALTTAQQASIVLSAAQDTLRQFGSNFNNTTFGGVVPQFAMTPRSAVATGGGFSGGSSGYASGAAASSAVGNGPGSFRSAPAPAPVASGGDRAAPAGDTKNIEIVNNYAAPPPDPHSWSKGMAFEVGAAL